MSKRSFQTLLLALGLLGANVASADTIIFQEGALLPGGGPYTGTQDTEIRGSNPATSLGSGDPHARRPRRPERRTQTSEAQALLRFDNLFGALPDQIPLGSTITSAVLTLYVTNLQQLAPGNISVYQMTSGVGRDLDVELPGVRGPDRQRDRGQRRRHPHRHGPRG